MCFPILIIGFNRPDLMACQVNAVRPAKPSRLYFAVDGPRDDRSGEDLLCAKVREAVKFVDWPCEVKTLFREKNLGCKLGVSSAITWFFENEEAGIILEDDCRPSVDFLRFASEMLELYKKDERIGAVCGFNHYDLQSDDTASYHFSSHMDIWGWATWRRAWSKYDVDMKPYRENIDSIIDGSGMNAYARKFMHVHVDCLDRGLNTWDVQWSICSLANHWLNIVPKHRLVSQSGIDSGAATHTGGYNFFAKQWSSKTRPLQFPLSHPDDIICDALADRMRERMEGALFPRALTWIGSKLPVFCSVLTTTGRIAEKFVPILFRWP